MITKIFLNQNIADRISKGNLWIYNNEIGDVNGEYNDGDIVEVYSYNGSFVGKGYINSLSIVRVRLLSHCKETLINQEFFYKKILNAWEFRQQIGYTENCCLIFGETDSLPGLYIYKYNDYFVLNFTTLGMYMRKNEIVKAVNRIFEPKGIIERNKTSNQEIEKIQTLFSFLSHPFDTQITIIENELKFKVDLERGDNFGFYLNRKKCREALKNVSLNARVLDVFCNTGSFSIYAAKYGATSVLGIDNNEYAINLARQNAQINQYDTICNFECDNAFESLKNKVSQKQLFDIVILDLPNFVKTKKDTEVGIKALKHFLYCSFRLINNNGFLLFSFSNNVLKQDDIKRLISEEAYNNSNSVTQVMSINSIEDQPIAWNCHSYLEHTCYLLRVSKRTG